MGRAQKVFCSRPIFRSAKTSKSRSSDFFCSDTQRKRLLRRLLDSLWCVIQEEVYIMGLAHRGFHFIREMIKNGGNWKIPEAKQVQYDIFKHFAFFDILCFFHGKRWKQPFLYLKNGLSTYDLSRNHSNRFSPKLCQIVCKGYAFIYWKCQTTRL